jgi:tetratricopeptide (TPR) repeat protein
MKDVLLKPPEKLSMDWYGQGWAMTHFLTFSKERSRQLRAYLAALTAGKPPEEAAKAFGDLDELNREAHLYVVRGVFNYRPVQVPIERPVIKGVALVGAAEAALIPETIAFDADDLGEYRKAGDREEERRRRLDVLARIRAKAAQYANDPFALYLLAQAEKANGEPAAAERAVDRLLVVQPSHVGGISLKSLFVAQRALKLTGEARLQAAAEARHLSVVANKADPDNPLAYVAYYESFHAAGVTPPKDAVEGLVAAVEKLPGDTGLRQTLVDEFAAEGQYSAAIATLMPLANSPHDSPLRTAAREKLAKLQAALAARNGGAKGPTTAPDASVPTSGG